MSSSLILGRSQDVGVARHHHDGIEVVEPSVPPLRVTLPLVASQIMTRDVAAVTVDARYEEILAVMNARRVRGLPVLDGSGGALVGVVTESDLARRVVPGLPGGGGLALLEHLLDRGDLTNLSTVRRMHAEQLMTAHPVVAFPAERLEVLVRRLAARAIKRLPVVEEGRLVGIVTRGDVIGAFARRDDLLAAELRSVLREQTVPGAETVEIDVRDGVLTLRGTVTYPADRRRLISRLGGVPGVFGLVDKLTLACDG